MGGDKLSHDGRENTQLRLITDALKVVKELFGRTPASEFGPKKLRLVREQMTKKGWARSVVNAQANRVRRMFKWAAGEELISGEIFNTLKAVEGLRRGSPGVRETEPVKPVPEAIVEATLPHLSLTIHAMVRVQLATGMRPGEVCMMRAADIDRTGDPWVYTPTKHKTQHHGHSRTILIGPRAQQLLVQFLAEAGDGYLFSPLRAEAARQAIRRGNRKSKMTPSQSQRKAKSAPRRAKRDRYDVLSYRNAVYRACDQAFLPPVPLCQRDDETADLWKARLGPEEKQALSQWRSQHRWTVNQLRHTAATLIRHKCGLDVARVVLGHQRVNTTELYAEPDRAKAAAAMAALG